MRKLRLLAITATAVVGLAATTIDKDDLFEITKNIEIYVNVYKQLHYNYVDDIDPGELMRVGIDAMVGSLDPYTNFISENQIERYRLNKDDKFSGIGAEMGIVDGLFTVLEPFDGSPALAAGLRAGDQVTEIDGLSTAGKSLEEVNRIVRGAPGTDMALRVQRVGESGLLDIALTRGDVTMPNVPYSGIVKDHVGYVKLTTFTQGASANIKKAMEELKEEDPELSGLILDLRNNGGGLLAEAVDISSLWIPQDEVVVTTRGKVRDRDQTYKTRRTPYDLNIPIAVLINKKSASASEIVSGVVQDYDRGVLIGQRSFGKGLVQNQQEVGYNNRVKFTTHKYYIPSRRCIQSKEYENGEPVDIPVDRRSKFKTRNGRTVLDGGGVAPDIVMPAAEEGELLKALNKNHVIHKYVNQYVLSNDSITAAGSFRFDDYEGFVAFAKGLDWSYETEAEKKLAEVSEKVDESLAAEVAALKSKMQTAKANAYTSEKAMIVKAIEQDIVSRYFFQAGKAHQALNDDREVLKAVEVLTDAAQYKSILSL